MNQPRQKIVPPPSGQARNAVAKAASRLRPSMPDLDRWHCEYAEVHKDRLAADLDMVVDAVGQSSRVVEIGAVPLVLTCAMRDLGISVTGLDIAPERYKEAISQNSLDVRTCDVERETFPVESDTADLVLFNEVFEHLRIDLIHTMSEVLRILRPGGTLLLSTPNLRSYRGMRRLLLEGEANAVGASIFDEYRKLKTLGHMGHVREYTPQEVVSFLKAVGFSAPRVLYRGATTRSARLVARLWPGSLPFMTVCASKPST